MKSPRLSLLIPSAVILAGVLAGPANPLSAQQNLQTVAEASGFTRTSLHAEVLEFVTELKGPAPWSGWRPWP